MFLRRRRSWRSARTREGGGGAQRRSAAVPVGTRHPASAYAIERDARALAGPSEVEETRPAAYSRDLGAPRRFFKPENVMIGEDGRVRVMDFGLASGALELAAEQAPTLDSMDEPTKLTQTGAVIGTPAYMAPEQLGGQVVDARSDQFGFAVSLYEALHGCRPYAGKTVKQLRLAILSGARTRTERSPGVPVWLDRILARALAADPDARFPSMTELLEALDDDPAARRRWRFGVGTGVAVPAALWITAAAIGVRASDSAPCRGLEDGLEGVWDPARRAQAREAFAKTGASYADATWARVEASLDDYTGAWVTARVAACEASRDGLQSDALLDLKVSCLDEHLAVVRAVVDELVDADEELVSRAIQGVDALPRVEVCADADALLAAVPPPTEPARAARAELLGRQLGVVEARVHLGRYALASAQLDETQAAAAELAYAPLEIRARLWRARVQHDLGEFQEAAATLTEVYYDALGQRMFDEATQAAAELVETLTWVGDEASATPWLRAAAATADAARRDWAQAVYLKAKGHFARSRGEHAEARDALERALVIMERVKGAEALSTSILRVDLAGVAQAEGRVAEADALLERAMEIFERVLGPDSRMLSTAINDMGASAYLRGDYRQARALFERALAIDTRTLGPTHPEISTVLSNLGALAKLEGDGAAARAYLEKALVILERAVGPDTLELAPILINLGSVEVLVEDHERAREHYQRALALRERYMGPEHPEVAEALHYLATVAEHEGRYDEAEEAYARARVIFEASLSPDHLKVLSLRDSWTGLLEKRGRAAAAEVEAEAVLAARERLQGPEHPGCRTSLLNLGRARLDLERPDDAIAPLERAVALFGEGASASRRAPSRFALARALWDASPGGGRDRARARDIAVATRRDLEDERPVDDEQLRALDAWLVGHKAGG
ncbi:MAG: tetratricopeptide repeat protein [Myxococcales bacterium]|nr:tetratricopeptide repeat protein [Myxococcales bacterium]